MLLHVKKGWMMWEYYVFKKENWSSFIIENSVKRVTMKIEFIWFNCLELWEELSKIRSDKNW